MFRNGEEGGLFRAEILSRIVFCIVGAALAALLIFHLLVDVPKMNRFRIARDSNSD